MARGADKRETFRRILDEATALFSTRGYKRTRLAEVAAAVGVTEPALYRHFRSKDALFDEVVRRAAARGGYEPPATLPVESPAEGSTVRFLRAFFRENRALPKLEAATRGPTPKTAPAASAELAAIATELFELANEFRVGARLMSASALESPELSELWEREIQRPVRLALDRYFEKRCEAGVLRAPGPIDASAAVLLNLVGTHAVYTDLLVPVGDGSDAATRSAVVDAAVAMFSAKGRAR